jgi:3-deoxy-manno-octulosonate cytidylyltransferase (CMP-KDO synthetase)
LAEACQLLGLPNDAVVVNVQGDEPLMQSELINDVARLLIERPEASMSTAAHAIGSLIEFTNPNVVKVVMDARQLALYFSRAPIAWWRDGQTDTGFKALPDPAPLRHIGIYGYRAGFLALFPQLPPSPLETTESLEQLRALWHGHRIAVHVTSEAPGPGVDTPEDLARVRQLLA